MLNTLIGAQPKAMLIFGQSLFQRSFYILILTSKIEFSRFFAEEIAEITAFLSTLRCPFGGSGAMRVVYSIYSEN